MKEKHAKKLKMYERVIASMNEHLGEWKHVDALSETNDRFVRNFKKLTKHLPDAEISLEDLKGSYVEKKNQLSKHLENLKEVVSIYLSDHRKKDLKQFSKLNKKKLHEMNDRQLQEVAGFFSLVFKKSIDPSKKGEPIGGYGVTDEMIDQLKSLNKEFTAVKQHLKDSRKKHRDALKNIQFLIAENDRLLKKRMDKFVILLEGQHPGFSDAYLQARESKKPSKQTSAKKKQEVQTEKVPVKTSNHTGAKTKPASAKTGAGASN